VKIDLKMKNINVKMWKGFIVISEGWDLLVNMINIIEEEKKKGKESYQKDKSANKYKNNK